MSYLSGRDEQFVDKVVDKLLERDIRIKESEEELGITFSDLQNKIEED